VTQLTDNFVPAGRRPIVYRELAAQLRKQILAGEYPPGTRLPTDAEMTNVHGVSRQTVRQAFAELVSEGLVYRVRGNGTFATGGRGRGAYLRTLGSIEDLLALSLDTELEIVRPMERRVDVEAASRLQLPTDEVAATLIVRLHRDLPFCATFVSLPLAVRDELPTEPNQWAPGLRSRTTVIGLIEDSRYGPIAGADQSIGASVIPDDIAPLIDCDPHAAVMRIDRLYFNREGTPVELAISYFNPDRYSYRVEIRRT
jgi:GntR family transcriptional regulator